MRIYQTADYNLIAKLNQSIHTLHTTLYPQYFKKYNFEAMRDFFKRAIHDPAFIFLVMEESNEKVGYAWIEIRRYPENTFRKSYESVYVHQFSIEPNWQKQGFGAKLMKKIEEIAKDHNIDKVELDYWADNVDAKNFYKKNGFTVYHEYVYKNMT